MGPVEFARYAHVTDDELVVRDVTEDLAALLEYTRDEMIGRSAWDFVSPDFAAARRQTIERQIREHDGTFESTTEVVTKSGRRIPWRYRVDRLGGRYYARGWPVGRERELVELARAHELAHELFADPWLSKAEAGVYCGRSTRTLERAVAAGELQAGGTPRRRAYRRSWLDDWLARGLVVLVVLVLAGLGLVDVDVDVPWHLFDVD